ncbi:MAG: hypothetical protein QOF67_3491 [Mycobacterium sp.]|jgi:acetyltransferase-like isoleucine patch superfamily enzyme|nr:hypothetical protein [Mycobacterium sp.]
MWGNRGGNRRPNVYLSLFAWLLPNSRIKTWILRRLGNEIGNEVVLGPCFVVNCGRFVIADKAVIFPRNAFKNLAMVKLGYGALIGQLNQFTAAPEYQQYSDRAGCLLMGEQSAFTNRHYVDCSGQVILRPYGVVGGVRSIVQTHQIDLKGNKTTVGKVVIDENAISLTACVLLKDSYLPPRSVLGAHSLLMKPSPDDELKSGLYAGNPAKFVHEIDEFTWWGRETWLTGVVDCDDSMLEPVDTKA